MYKRLILPVLMTILLVACGQSMDQEINADDSHSNTGTTKQEEEMEKDNLSELKVHFLDVGQADATFFQFGTHAILFDTGDWSGNEVVDYITSLGVSKIDLVIGSHPDADHIGQLANVMQSFKVEEVWLSGNESTSQTFQRGLEAILASDAEYAEPRSGEHYRIGSMDIKILNPKSITGASNEESIAMLLTYGNIKFILTGDADQNAEQQMMKLGIDLDADIMKLGHHGSNTSSSPSFIQAVSPEVAIYSAGAENSYGHPHAEVVSRIQKAGIDLYGTDVHGTIVVTTDGINYKIDTKKQGTIKPKSTEHRASSPSTSVSSSSRKKSGGSSSNNKQSTSSGSCIDINTASNEEVERIKHIGPELAQDLINLRPFSSVSDLTRIKGIGPARIKDIEEEGLACVK
ncbi:MBL fold metallo-hydrolase [Ornithinibacillus bavariensis]|uniref:Competence protein ComEC n=1 Tax=Ornithinibacillus bavariensis TaxID=545502 RepID=A0A920C5S9_9BACI|nr:MBL fold metallo-hydrolase [Ornithinibacillus bavariensis]GIO27055.1 competence protein ComEC [Ornithinibacillus bavariensis]HAM80128.1 MBL fold metallo-hydrolase [Ornithinibacillus sp.]